MSRAAGSPAVLSDEKYATAWTLRAAGSPPTGRAGRTPCPPRRRSGRQGSAWGLDLRAGRLESSRRPRHRSPAAGSRRRRPGGPGALAAATRTCRGSRPGRPMPGPLALSRVRITWIRVRSRGEAFLQPGRGPATIGPPTVTVTPKLTESSSSSPGRRRPRLESDSDPPSETQRYSTAPRRRRGRRA